MHDFKARRLSAGLSQAALGHLVGCNQTTIGRVEKGQESTPALLKAIDAALPKTCALPIVRGAAEKPVAQPDLLATATAALHEKISLQTEIIESQRQTIDAQKQTIDALQMRLSERASP